MILLALCSRNCGSYNINIEGSFARGWIRFHLLELGWIDVAALPKDSVRLLHQDAEPLVDVGVAVAVDGLEHRVAAVAAHAEDPDDAGAVDAHEDEMGVGLAGVDVADLKTLALGAL